jgi:hypothetical protein
LAFQVDHAESFQGGLEDMDNVSGDDVRMDRPSDCDSCRQPQELDHFTAENQRRRFSSNRE